MFLLSKNIFEKLHNHTASPLAFIQKPYFAPSLFYGKALEIAQKQFFQIIRYVQKNLFYFLAL